MDERTDIELVALIAREGDAAVRILFDRYSPIMLALSRKILSRPDEAEEVVNDAFMELFRKSGLYSAERGHVKSYLLILTRSRSLDRLRQRKSGPRREVARLDAQDESLLTANSRPTDRAEQSEEADRMRAVVDCLPPDERLAIESAYYGGLSHQEIAEKLGEPLGTVKGRIRRGLIRMRDHLRIRDGKSLV